ncbi:hypothetical protein BD779DRAFT_1468883 [Infundibulicybe gibba]|nr:hypothetical protein BD779DRAFT_1468883 [Infundibulicybe gibba]
MIVIIEASPASKPPPPRGSVIANFPNELILKIVEYGEDILEYGLPGNFAILASHVCSRWREIVLSAPLLWSDVRVSNLPRGIPKLDRASAFVSRSSPCPIRVTVLVIPTVNRYPQVEGIEEAVRVMCTRPKDTGVRTHSYPEFRRQGDHDVDPRGPVPLLESLSIKWMEPWDVDDPPVVPFLQVPYEEVNDAHEVMENFPNLKSLLLASIVPVWSQFPSRNLTTLELSNLASSTPPTWSQIRGILQANAVTLENLTLGRGLPKGLSSGAPIVMSALTYLDVDYPFPAALEQFMAIVQVPHLKDLFIHDLKDTGFSADDLNGVSVPKIMMEHMPIHQLRILCLSAVEFTTPAATGEGESHAHAFFSRLHALETLTLVKPEPQVLEALSRASPEMTPGDVAPRLALPAPQLSRLFLRNVYADTLGDLICALTTQGNYHDTTPPMRQLSELTVSIFRDGYDSEAHLEEALETAKTIADIVHCTR